MGKNSQPKIWLIVIICQESCETPKNHKMIPNAQLKQADEQSVNLFDSPKLKQQNLINILSEKIDDRYRKFLIYGALEGKDLVFYFSHNAIAYEFINNVDTFRAAIIPLYKEQNMKETLYFTGIKAKTKHRVAESEKPKERYKDRARGDFVIEVEDDAVRIAFEKIRATIQSNQ